MRVMLCKHRVALTLMLSSILTACGGGSGNAPNSDQTNSSSSESSLSSSLSSTSEESSSSVSSATSDSGSSESTSQSSADDASSSSEQASSSSEATDVAELNQVQIAAVAGGGAQFSIRLSEKKDAVHLFARRNGQQDYVVNDIQSDNARVTDHGDGSYTYQVTRPDGYQDGDLIEARIYTYQPDSGQIFYPGPADNTWVELTYSADAVTDPIDGGASSSSSESSSEDSSSSLPSSEYTEGGYVPDYDPGYEPQSVSGVMPLFHQGTPLEAVIRYEAEDAVITRFSDRARDRHAKEDQFQQYDHYLSFYWEHRTASVEIVDKVAKGGSTVRMNVRTEWRLNDTEAENRWFYIGRNTVAEFCDNGTMEVLDDLNYYKERSHNCREGRAIQIGDKLEFEISQFLDPSVPNGRAPYYGTTYLYIVGEGMVPWNVGGATPAGGIKDSVAIPRSAWLGGDTTIHANTSGEPHNRFMQMATNLGYENAQPFVEGRRLLHSSFDDGTHDENVTENPVYEEVVGMAGPRYINEACTDCHVRNGRAVPESIGEHLDKWVFRVADAEGNAHPALGHVFQGEANSGADSEGEVVIASWTEENGLRSPNFEFSGVTPERFSGRIAPAMVGMGLLEAIPEEAILAQEDPDDANGDGISGRAHRVIDPQSGETRLGRFGWKAGKVSIKHQTVSALNTDMGVMTAILPDPDCGSTQADCGPSGAELDEEFVDRLVKYVALLGVPPQRDYDSPSVQSGAQLFEETGCAGCHTPSHQTSEYHPFAELRDQTIHPYTDLLLHDMGPGLADNLGEGDAAGSEWRTAPLWGLGLSACVTGGMTVAPQGQRECTPEEGYLHDGRARTVEEAILWHGGEADDARAAYQGLSAQQQEDMLNFLYSL